MSDRDQAKVLAIIPARSGSKRVKDKNIRELGGLPLIAHTINAAHACKGIDRTIVSTDDESIAELARHYNAEVPFIRPSELALDSTPDQPVLVHALRAMMRIGFTADLVVLLRPTAPFRTSGLIADCIEKWKSGNADSVRSMSKAEGIHHPYWMFEEKDGEAKPMVEGKTIKEFYQSQLLPPVFHLNGAVDAISANIILEEDNLYGERMAILETPANQAVDIDTEEDFEWAEFLWQNRSTK